MVSQSYNQRDIWNRRCNKISAGSLNAEKAYLQYNVLLTTLRQNMCPPQPPSRKMVPIGRCGEKHMCDKNSAT